MTPARSQRRTRHPQELAAYGCYRGLLQGSATTCLSPQAGGVGAKIEGWWIFGHLASCWRNPTSRMIPAELLKYVTRGELPIKREENGASSLFAVHALCVLHSH
mmetsp:Transcript_6508/g.13858  ORF Transcript_6508/g.13858 Transcript_6508/m.13858 type:complete len:104 (+) Transcript_6508:94-405(+)